MKIKQTFEAGKTIRELGIDVTRKFEVMIGDSCFNKGDILELQWDDNTTSPRFSDKDGYAKYFYLKDLAYAYEEDKINPGDKVGVSDISQENADKDLKNGKNKYYVGESIFGGFIVEYIDRSCGYFKYISNKGSEKKVEPLTDKEIKSLRKLIK